MVKSTGCDDQQLCDNDNDNDDVNRMRYDITKSDTVPYSRLIPCTRRVTRLYPDIGVVFPRGRGVGWFGFTRTLVLHICTNV